MARARLLPFTVAWSASTVRSADVEKRIVTGKIERTFGAVNPDKPRIELVVLSRVIEPLVELTKDSVMPD